MQLRQLVNPHISTEERTLILKWLGESHQEFFEAIDRVSDAQWEWKPAAERWSLGETAEHIVLAEALLFGFVRKAMAAPPNLVWEEQTKGKTELLIQVIPSRLAKGVAPTRSCRARCSLALKSRNGLRSSASTSETLLARARWPGRNIRPCTRSRPSARSTRISGSSTYLCTRCGTTNRSRR